MTPSPSSSPCDRLMIWTVSLIVLTCVIVSALLAWHGQAAAIAAFIGLAGTALGILSPSPLKQHGQVEQPAVTATTTTGDVSVNPPVIAQAAGEGADNEGVK